MKINKWDALLNLATGIPVQKENKKYFLENAKLYVLDLSTGEVSVGNFIMNNMSLKVFTTSEKSSDVFYSERLKDFQAKRSCKSFKVKYSSVECTYKNDTLINIKTNKPASLCGLEILGIFDRDIEADIASDNSSNVFTYIDKGTGKIINQLDFTKLDYDSFPIATHYTKVIMPCLSFKSVIYMLHILGNNLPDFVDTNILNMYLKGRSVEHIHCKTTDWIYSLTKRIIFLEELLKSIKPECRAEYLTAHLNLFKYM